MASERPAMRVFAIWVWASLLITWIFRSMKDKGNWSGAAPDTEAFLHLSIRRRRASLRAVRLGSLVRAHVSSLSQLKEFDWRVRRKKKLWKT
jgi:hypothetical protein